MPKSNKQSGKAKRVRSKKIPDGAIVADSEKQVYGLGGPLPYYTDAERTCVQCQQPFLFSAQEQKFWYETLGFNNYSKAIRCVRCRKQKRSDKAIQRQLQLARECQKQHPDDPLAHLALAEALVQHYVRLGQGNLDDAVAASRKASTLDPELHEAVYWEAVSQLTAGRKNKAGKLYRRFLSRAQTVYRCRHLVRRAQQKLQPA